MTFFEKKIPTMSAISKTDDDKMEQEIDNKETTNNGEEIENIEEQNDEKKINNSLQNDDDIANQLDTLTQKNKELERKLLYLAAEYENNKKRSKIDLENANKFAISKFAVDAINIYDILQTALQNIDPADTDKVLFDGVKMTIGEFDKMFERIQINKIYPETGSLFDHNKHEAISRVQSELEVGCIVKVVRPGYELYGRLLRPAMVIVSGG